VSVAEIQDRDGVRLIAFNRPDVANAFDFALYRAVSDALREADTDDSIRAVVLTGRGRVFSAGQDLEEMAHLAAGAAPEGTAGGFNELMDALVNLRTPLLAAVNGAGVGLGCTLLAHCDLVLIAEQARLKVPFAELGVPPEAASSYLFPLRMGWQQAARVLFAAEWISAAQAVEIGMALRVCPEESVVEDTLELARHIAGHPGAALTAIKAVMKAPHAQAIAEARARENEAFSRLLSSAATRDALDRFTTRS
jgi:enoyl-CoA hydratase/carnithine racemase